jgi:hypothetical protein
VGAFSVESKERGPKRPRVEAHTPGVSVVGARGSADPPRTDHREV